MEKNSTEVFTNYQGMLPADCVWPTDHFWAGHILFINCHFCRLGTEAEKHTLVASAFLSRERGRCFHKMGAGELQSLLTSFMFQGKQILEFDITFGFVQIVLGFIRFCGKKRRSPKLSKLPHGRVQPKAASDNGTFWWLEVVRNTGRPISGRALPLLGTAS